MQKHYKTIVALSILPQVLVVKLASKYPEFIETYYSNGIYIYMSKAFRYVFGWIPFSIGDVFYTVAIIYGLRWLFYNRKRLLSEPLTWFRDVFIVLSLVYFVFHLFWGFNYYREPLHKTLGYSDKYTTEELILVVEQLVSKTNDIHKSLVEHDTLKVMVPYSKKEMLKTSAIKGQNFELAYPNFISNPKSVKRSIYSIPLTYMGFGGYLNPFTNEAQINSVNPLHKIPVVIYHEQAHQMGYAAENEANFIGHIKAMISEDPYFKFSGHLAALKYCLIELRLRAPQEFDELIKTVNSGVLKSYQEEAELWAKYDNIFEPLFSETFNQFLKANNQKEGINSYNYVVALLVNHFKP